MSNLPMETDQAVEKVVISLLRLYKTVVEVDEIF
jgi:hypothetical protein